MITDYNRLSGLHKVAILFTVLGESLAMSLIKGLSRTEIRKIRATISEMDSVSFTLKRRIKEEFYFGFLCEQFQEDGNEEDEGPIKPFESLTEMTDEQLIALLANQDVPVVAIALAQLDAEKRMTILERMEPEEKGKTLIELGSLQDIPHEAILELDAYNTGTSPLMGWISSSDTMSEVKLEFSTKEQAINYAKKNNVDYYIIEPQEQKIVKKSYTDNFMK